jgi:hypothetical protein
VEKSASQDTFPQTPVTVSTQSTTARTQPLSASRRPLQQLRRISIWTQSSLSSRTSSRGKSYVHNHQSAAPCAFYALLTWIGFRRTTSCRADLDCSSDSIFSKPVPNHHSWFSRSERTLITDTSADYCFNRRFCSTRHPFDYVDRAGWHGVGNVACGSPLASLQSTPSTVAEPKDSFAAWRHRRGKYGTLGQDHVLVIHESLFIISSCSSRLLMACDHFDY